MGRISKADILNDNLKMTELRKLAKDQGISLKGISNKKDICREIARKIDLKTTKKLADEAIKKRRKEERRIAAELTKGPRVPKDVSQLISLVQHTPLPKIKSERYLEDTMYATLATKFPNLTKQGGSVNFYGFDHRPDYVVKNMAIELKTVSGGGDIQTAIGQGVIYRRRYDHVVLILYDTSKGKRVKGTPKGAKVLADMGIYVTILK